MVTIVHLSVTPKAWVEVEKVWHPGNLVARKFLKKTIVLSLSKLITESKNSLSKVVHFGILFDNVVLVL